MIVFRYAEILHSKAEAMIEKNTDLLIELPCLPQEGRPVCNCALK